MKRRSYELAIAFMLCAAAVADGPAKPQNDVFTIPLDRIWALDTPDTLDVRKLDADASESLVSDISRILSKRPTKDDGPKAAFAVLGEGLESLQTAHAVLTEDMKPRTRFPSRSKISIVFFSYRSGSYVHLQEVTRSGEKVKVTYRFVPHRTREMTSHFALIPLGELPAGKFTVDIASESTGQMYSVMAESNVSKSFSFSVEAQKEK